MEMNYLFRVDIRAEATITSGGVTTWESYTYDGEGNRISVTVRGGGRLEPETTYYVNDACSSLTHVLATTDAYGNRMESTVRGLGLIASIGEETTYFVTDAKGSVTALIQDGVVTDAYRYDAYGNLIERSGDSNNPYRYNGEAYSEETGLYYQRARYMNPETGTFISMDAYSGTLGNPVSQHKYLYACMSKLLEIFLNRIEIQRKYMRVYGIVRVVDKLKLL